jgi:hypothetical protein
MTRRQALQGYPDASEVLLQKAIKSEVLCRKCCPCACAILFTDVEILLKKFILKKYQKCSSLFHPDEDCVPLISLYISTRRHHIPEGGKLRSHPRQKLNVCTNVSS